jgi:hypothetical protein
MRAGLLFTLIATGASAAGHECTLAGEGEVDLCEKVYWRSRIAAVAIPSYVLALDGQHVRHGISWTIAIDVPKDEWSEYFTLGVAKDALPRGFPFQLGLAASFVWYPDYALEGRLVARARIISLAWPNSPALSWAHLTVGLGAAGGTVGVAPRVELRARVGHIAWGGLVLALGFTPYLSKSLFVADLSVGVEAPWVWWW